jgi:hypothetical protein
MGSAPGPACSVLSRRIMRARSGVVLLRAARIVTGISSVSASTAAPAAVPQMEPISFWRIGNTRLLLTHVVWPRLATSRAAIRK